MSAIKTAISMEEELLRRIDVVARELEEPRSRVLARAAEDFLRHRESRQLLERLDTAHAGDEVREPVRSASVEKALRQRKHRQLVEGEW
ncbi:MAG TPA: hypothetical protein VLF66_15180 [Thermoanaerobaculia bacterium]|nr:hypothetical protein [Thermoanaerobaculia bacterium]